MEVASTTGNDPTINEQQLLQMSLPKENSISQFNVVGREQNMNEEIFIDYEDNSLQFITDDAQTDIGDDSGEIHYMTSLLGNHTVQSPPYGVTFAKKITNLLQTSVSKTISGGKSLLGAVKKPLMTGNDEHFEVIATDEVLQLKTRVTSPNTVQRKVFNLSGVYSKVIGWRKKATGQIRRRIQYDNNYLRPPTTSPFQMRRHSKPIYVITCSIPPEVWAYNILPYMSWTDMLTIRILSKMFLIMIQEQCDTWNELYEAKNFKYFQEPTDLWRNTKPYFYFELDEAIVKHYFQENLIEQYRKFYRNTYTDLKLTHSCQVQGNHTSHGEIEKQENFISYLSSSRAISERKKQMNQRKNLSQQELFKSVEHRSAWHRVFTILISILAAIASLVCVTVKDFAFQQSVEWQPLCTNTSSIVPDSYNMIMDKYWTIPFIPVYIGMLFILGTILYFWLKYYVNNNKYSLENDGRPRSPNEIYMYMTLTVVCCILFFVFLNIRLVHPYCNNLIESYYSGEVELTEAESSSLLLSEVFNNGVVLCSPLLSILGLFTLYLLRSTHMGVQYTKYAFKFAPKYYLIGIGMWKFVTPFIIWLFSSFSVILFMLYLVFDTVPSLVPAIPIMVLHLALILLFGWSIIYYLVMFITCSLNKKLIVENAITCIYGFFMISSPIVFYVLLGLGLRSGYVAIPCCVFFLTLLLYGMNYMNYLEDILTGNESSLIPFS